EKIDSCPIEGFEKEAVEKVLKIDSNQYEVAVIVALGFRSGEQSVRRRHSFQDLVEYR
ncbi:MAG: NAD(P)H-dependent oxidoreductase, partial [Deltaproteobacteria bacterium]|nr:NAD(P)H-dependent oxidoreductase [Deltaproteobacteria bacterium]